MKPRIALQTGATMVEFALVLLLFLMFLLGVIDFSRMLYMWNASTEAARAGARYAVVCDDTFTASAVRTRMQRLLPQAQNINVTWEPAGCNHTDCQGVTITMDMTYQWISPIPGIARLPAMPMPRFSTYLTREVMRQDPFSYWLCY